MKAPPTQFTTTDDGVRIAYTTWGSGPTMVISPGIVSNVELFWENELHSRVLERLGRHLRLIQFDKRGIGMSDRFDALPANDQRISDFLAVMAAEEVEKAHISGISEGGVMAKILAAQYPERTDRLALANTEAPNLYTDRVSAQ